MRVKYKLFPYPVLCEEIDDYKDNLFIVKPNITQDINKIIISFEITINDIQIKNMINNGQLDIAYHIECGKTLYRNLFIENKLSSSVYINKNDLNGNVDICCFIVAKKNINKYRNPNFNDDYSNNSFDILKGNIMGFYNIPRISIIKDPEELAKMSSIFSIVKKEDNKEKIMNINIDDDKIKIELGTKEFESYNKNAINYQDYCHSMLIMPALIYALDMILIDGDQYSDYRWYKALETTLSKANIVLNAETINNQGSYVLAQKLLNSPISRALAFMDSEVE